MSALLPPPEKGFSGMSLSHEPDLPWNLGQGTLTRYSTYPQVKDAPFLVPQPSAPPFPPACALSESFPVALLPRLEITPTLKEQPKPQCSALKSSPEKRGC